MAEFEVVVSKADFKFNCAHFIAYKGFRERLHGHNYQIAVKLTGGGSISPDGYLIDFGDVKKCARFLCSGMNEYFILPMNSDVLCIDCDADPSQVIISCEDGAHFSLPRSDCLLLPLVHSSAEEISHYLWCRIVRHIGWEALQEKGAKSMEVTVSEAPQQSAVFRCPLPTSEEQLVDIEKPKIFSRPKPCLAAEGDDV